MATIGPITLTLTRTPSGRYDMRYPDGVEPSAPDITISTVPDFTLTAGTSFSQNFDAYGSGSGLSGATYALERVSGDTLATLDLTFSTSTLSGSTPDVGSGVYRVKITKSGFDFLSNNFSLVVNPAIVTDTQAPSEVLVIQASVVSATRIDLTIDWPSDVRTSTVPPTDPVKIVIERQVDGGAWSALTTLTAGGSQPNPPLSFTAIGGMAGTPTGLQNGADLTLTCSDGVFSSSQDQMAFYGGLVSGDFEVSWKTPNVASGYSWSGGGGVARQNRDPMCPSVMQQTRTNTNPAGAPCHFRSQQGGAITYTPDANVAPGTPVKLKRVGNLFTYQVWDATGQTWLTIGSGTVVMTDPIELGVHAERTQAGAEISVTIPQFRINKLGSVTHQDTTVTAGHTYGYRARARDSATVANDSAFSPVSTVATPTPSNLIRFTPGYYMAIFAILENASASTQIPQWISWINELANEPAVVGVKVFIRWRAVEGNTAGDYATGIARMRQLRDACAAINKKLWVSFLHVIFGGTSSDWTLYFPAYIVNESQYGISVMTNGKIARIWQEASMTRAIAQCLGFCNADNGHGVAFKDDPTIEAIQIDETGIGMAIGADGFSYQGVITQYSRWMTEMRAACPTLGLKLTANYLGSDDHMAQLLNVAVQQKCSVGGPDILPKEGIQANRIFTGTPPSESGGSQSMPVIDRRGVIPFCAEFQSPSVGGHEGNWTMEEMIGSTINGYPYTSGGIQRIARATQPSYIHCVRQTGSTVGINWNSPRQSDGAESMLSYIRRTNGAVSRPNRPPNY